MNQEQPCVNSERTITCTRALKKKKTDLAWHEVTAVTMNGVWKNFCPQFFFFFMDVRRWMKSPKRSSATQ